LTKGGGYGFLTPDDNSGDCFAHISDVTEGSLRDDTPVEFDVIVTPKGRKAVNIRAKWPIMRTSEVRT
jgi:cold shock CspA family protein